MQLLSKIISGGQTGVDQAALRAAQKSGLACGGWCPPGRVCESGLIPSDFPLTETPEERSSAAPEVPRSLRTEWNVRDSAATLILLPKDCSRKDPGTDWTAKCANHYGRPALTCDPFDPNTARKIFDWLNGLAVHTLNVAGPSEKTFPGIGSRTYDVLLGAFNLSRSKDLFS
jgi:hypothetical protein